MENRDIKFTFLYNEKIEKFNIFEVDNLKKLILTGLILLSTMLTGCGLDDTQKAGVTYINNLFAKGHEVSAEERVNKAFSIYSKSIEEKWKRERGT